MQGAVDRTYSLILNTQTRKGCGQAAETQRDAREKTVIVYYAHRQGKAVKRAVDRAHPLMLNKQTRKGGKTSSRKPVIV